jgi:AcrR family transcriptional regulator
MPKPKRDGWLRTERAELASDRILDAAEAAFTELGVARARIDDVARHAECSRGTIYRYFPNREALRRAYIAREARRLGASLADRLAAYTKPADILIEGMTAALAGVRARPALMQWFAPEALGTTSTLASSTPAVFDNARAMLGALIDRADAGLRPGLDRDGAAEWMVRVLVSLLGMPGPTPRDAAAEDQYLRAFLLPALV